MLIFFSDNLTYGVGITHPGHLNVAFSSTYDGIKTSHNIIKNTGVGIYFELTEATSPSYTCEALPTGIYSEVGAPCEPDMEVSTESCSCDSIMIVIQALRTVTV